MRPPSPPKIGPGRIGHNEKRGRFGNNWQDSNADTAIDSTCAAACRRRHAIQLRRRRTTIRRGRSPSSCLSRRAAVTDVVVRAVAAKVQERFGKPVVVENRAGAGGVIATADVVQGRAGRAYAARGAEFARRQSDAVQIPAVRHAQGSATAIAGVSHAAGAGGQSRHCRCTRSQTSLRCSSRSPGQIDFAHGGPGSAIHLAGELFQTMTGTKMTAVAYRGAPLGLTDVIGRSIRLDVRRRRHSGRANQCRIGAGTRRELDRESSGVARCSRLLLRPVCRVSTPSAGRMICAPAATPKPIVDKLATALDDAAEMPDVQSLIVKLGTIPVEVRRRQS